MSPAELLERLAAHKLLADAPPREQEWVASHGRLLHLQVGDLISSRQQGPVEDLMILLSGRYGFYKDRGGVLRKVIEWKGGEDITGLLPYSRLTVPPGEGRVEETGDVVFVHRDHFPELIRECHVFTSKIVQVMLDRARHFQKDDLQRERLVALGRMAAGLAHELDNPTSAALRSAKLLGSLLRDSDAAARALGATGISSDELGAIEKLRDGCLTARVQQVRSPLEQARREEAISDWLDDHRASGVSIDALADAPITLEMLDSLAAMVGPAALEAALRWLAAGCALLAVAAEIEHASARTSQLVKAVKGFSQVDKGGVPQPVDLEEGLMQTLAMLRSKARSKSVSVGIEVDPGLPRVHAVSGELNQIWHNLIDNALDAVREGGSVEVGARREGTFVVVSVMDDGPGIPPDVVDRIFEPFFTTKPVGKGTGLGLDIVQRLVDGQNGSVEVTSEPGRTEFRVRLPVPAASDHETAR